MEVIVLEVVVVVVTVVVVVIVLVLVIVVESCRCVVGIVFLDVVAAAVSFAIAVWQVLLPLSLAVAFVVAV